MSHLILIGRSPADTMQATPALRPEMRSLGNEKGSTTGDTEDRERQSSKKEERQQKKQHESQQDDQTQKNFSHSSNSFIKHQEGTSRDEEEGMERGMKRKRSMISRASCRDIKDSSLPLSFICLAVAFSCFHVPSKGYLFISVTGVIVSEATLTDTRQVHRED